MKYIILDKFTNFIVTNEEGETIIFDSIEKAQNEANECQDGLVIPLNTDKLFTKAQILDILISFAQSMYPKEFNSSKELEPEDFLDVPIYKAKELSLIKEFEKAVEIYKHASKTFLQNYKPENLL